MKFSTITGLALALATFDFAIAVPKPQEAGITSVSRMSALGLQGKKTATREAARGRGAFGKGKYKSKHGAKKCKNGKSDGTYACSNVDMHGFLSHEDMGSVTVRRS